jgi:NADH-quinone oxidoreductase subunit K
MSDQLYNHVTLGMALFALGTLSFLVKRNLIVMFLSAELMLQGVVICLLAFGRYHGSYQGQVFAVMVLTVAACEAALAMALFVVLYQRKKTLDIQVWSSLTEADPGLEPEEAPLAGKADDEELPRLTVAGPAPTMTGEKVRTHV